MKKIIIYSDLYLPTFPYLELPLYNELKRLNADVQFVLERGDYRFLIPELHQAFHPIATIITRPKRDILDLVDPSDLCIMRFAYKGLAGDVAAVLRSNKRKVLMLDPAAIDVRVRECPAQYLAVKSEWMRSMVLKKFPSAYRSVFATGTIHFDQAAEVNQMKLDRAAFLKSYGLDEDKKLALLTPANPAEIGHQKGVNDEYSKIIDIVGKECPGYNLMVKGHPMDYTASLPKCPGIIHKNEHYGNKHSWESFGHGIKVVRPEEGYVAFKLADVVLNVRSSIAMETPMFPTPLININRNKYVTNWPDSNDAGVMKDIGLNDLATTLNNNDYGTDAVKCQEYVSKFCGSNIGLAYKNIAEVALRLV